MLVSRIRPCLRLIKKRTFLLLVLTLSLGFSILSFFRSTAKTNTFTIEESEEADEIKTKLINLRRGNFREKSNLGIYDFDVSNEKTLNNLFINDSALNNSNFNSNSSAENCRNSVQGKYLISDDRGFVCKRKHIKNGGCCDIKYSDKQFSCKSCQTNDCCSIYEYCITCCLEPRKKELLRKVLIQQTMLSSTNLGIQALFSSITDHFEFCLVKCRTSSQSVLHENSYKNSNAKFCFGTYFGDKKQKIIKNETIKI